MVKFNKREFFNIFLNCRRGMLELDILLLNYLDVKYYDLNYNFKLDLYRMLLESDNNLYMWFIKKIPCNNDFNYIIIDILKINDMYDFC